MNVRIQYMGEHWEVCIIHGGSYFGNGKTMEQAMRNALILYLQNKAPDLLPKGERCV